MQLPTLTISFSSMLTKFDFVTLSHSVGKGSPQSVKPKGDIHYTVRSCSIPYVHYSLYTP